MKDEDLSRLAGNYRSAWEDGPGLGLEARLAAAADMLADLVKHAEMWDAEDVARYRRASELLNGDLAPWRELIEAVARWEATKTVADRAKALLRLRDAAHACGIGGDATVLYGMREE